MAMGTAENWNRESVVKELDPPAMGRLAEISAPVLVVVGDLDMPGILEIADAIDENVSGTEVVVMSGAAHMVNMEKPEEFNGIVLEFLAKTLPR
jgi:pimeloyl-ACP methyl ester carboxylesterase